MPITYILPDVAWACLLGGILRDAPTGAVIEVHTVAMEALALQGIREHGRTDMMVQRKGGAAGRGAQ